MTTSRFLIYGASDDLVEVENLDNPGVADEFETYDETATIRITAPDGSEHLDVEVEFTTRGWEIRLVSVTEAIQPSWPLQFLARPGFLEDPAVIVTAPEGSSFDLVED